MLIFICDNHVNPLAAMADQFPCAEPIYCNLILNQMYLKYFADTNTSSFEHDSHALYCV